MRTIIWMFISTLLAALAVHGLGVSSRHPARPGALTDAHTPPGAVDNGNGEDHRGGPEPSRYAR